MVSWWHQDNVHDILHIILVLLLKAMTTITCDTFIQIVKVQEKTSNIGEANQLYVKSKSYRVNKAYSR